MGQEPGADVGGGACSLGMMSASNLSNSSFCCFLSSSLNLQIAVLLHESVHQFLFVLGRLCLPPSCILVLLALLELYLPICFIYQLSHQLILDSFSLLAVGGSTSPGPQCHVFAQWRWKGLEKRGKKSMLSDRDEKFHFPHYEKDCFNSWSKRYFLSVGCILFTHNTAPFRCRLKTITQQGRLWRILIFWLSPCRSIPEQQKTAIRVCVWRGCSTRH